MPNNRVKSSIVLSERVTWESYKEHNYLFLNLNKLTDVELLDVLNICCEELFYQDLQSVRILVDVTDMNISSSMGIYVKKLSKENQKYLYKSAIVGVNFYLMPLYNMYRLFTGSKSRLYNDLETARDYIIS